LLEKEGTVAVHQSGHNSGVLHSGIYYPPGSVKAATAIAGKAAMIRFCATHGIATRTCGKVIVATAEDQIDRLHDLDDRARVNGVRAELVGRERLAELEPHAAGIEALHVPDTGIVDYAAVCRALLAEVLEAGAGARFSAEVDRIVDLGDRILVATSTDEWRARLLVNCAGLHSDRVAELDAPIADGTHIVPFRGEYYELRDERRCLVRGLIYPVPDPSFPFLGVHLTRTIDDRVLAGPNAVPALAREGYRWRDVSLRQVGSLVADRGLLSFGRKYWRTGAAEIWRSLNKRAFVRDLRRLVPEIEADDLRRSPAGVRAQALRPDGALVDDFALTYTGRAVHVLNAPSPAATASLAIGSKIAAEAIARLD
jgi:L-2-hydroxyglutarate oxidase LhgO